MAEAEAMREHELLDASYAAAYIGKVVRIRVRTEHGDDIITGTLVGTTSRAEGKSSILHFAGDRIVAVTNVPIPSHGMPRGEVTIQRVSLDPS